jgi:hypothetical protein
LYEPNDEGFYDVRLEDLRVMYETLEKELIAKVLASRPTRLGREARTNETGETDETDSSRLNGVWELYILKYLIRCCTKTLESEDEDATGESVSEFEVSDGPDNDGSAMDSSKARRKKTMKNKQRRGEASLRGWAHQM